ncbi:MAG: calcium/sodium antiporter [Candidatus Marinimicrobia bacterium]|nr:calcium/sodium antiporter [Candidatus Neomarinimicrobiota bacterium]
MSLTYSILILIAGTVLLYFGAHFLVKGSANIARILGVKPLIVGLTIVAFGTSMPEFTVSMFGVLKGVSDLSVGNIIGSNVANIGLILGVAGLIAPITLKYHHIRQQLLILLIGSLFFCIMAFDGISRWEGILFLVIIAAYVIYLIRSSREDEVKDELPKADNSIVRNILYTVGGIIGLVFASRAIIEGATDIAVYFGISHMVIGMTIVALGTSLPELAASIMAQVKHESDISIGNVIGSNMFNMFFVGGGAATVRGLDINVSIFTFEVPYMLLFTFLLFPIIFFSKGIKRSHAFVLLSLYILFIAISYIWL